MHHAWSIILNRVSQLSRKLYEAHVNVRTWNRTGRIKAICHTDAAAEPPWMACFACLDSASPVSCPALAQKNKPSNGGFVLSGQYLLPTGSDNSRSGSLPLQDVKIPSGVPHHYRAFHAPWFPITGQSLLFHDSVPRSS